MAKKATARADSGSRRLPRALRIECLDDELGDFVLDEERISRRPVVVLRPENTAIRRIDQGSGQHIPVTIATKITADYRFRRKLSTDRERIHSPAKQACSG